MLIWTRSLQHNISSKYFLDLILCWSDLVQINIEAKNHQLHQIIDACIIICYSSHFTIYTTTLAVPPHHYSQKVDGKD